jgi:hypothetical protein
MSKLIQHFILSFTLVFLAPVFSLAETQITSPFLLKLKKDKVFQKFFGMDGKLEKDISLSKPKVEIITDLDQLDLKSIELKTAIDAKVQASWWRENKLVMAGKLKKFELAIDELNYKFDQVNWVAGNEVRIKFHVRCFDLKMDLQEDLVFHMFSNLELKDRKPDLKIEKIDIMNKIDASKILLGRCEGPAGSEKMLRDVVKSYLTDSPKLSALFSPLIQSVLSDKQNKLLEQFSLASRLMKFKDLQVYQNFSAMDNCGKNHLCLHGNLSVRNAAAQNFQEIVVPVSNEEYMTWYKASFEEEAMAKVYVSKNLLHKLVQSSYQAPFMTYETQTDDHNALRDLMNSRFKQYHTWRDLRNFPEGSNFKITNYNAVAPMLGEISSSAFGLNIDFNANVLSQMKAPVENTYIDYAYLRSELSGLLQVKIEDNFLRFVVHANTVETSHQFDRSYLERYQPETKVKHKNIRKAMAELFEYKEMKAIFNSIKIGEDINMNLKAFEANTIDHIELLFD